MKSKVMMSALLLIGMIGPAKRASCNDKSVHDIDALQFRAPYSLGELLHDGLVVVEGKIQEIEHHDNNAALILDASAQVLENLHEQYNMMVDKSNIHTMHRDDRNFLQNMIDRIDLMIQSLENDHSLAQAEHRAVQKNLELLADLKAKLAS